MKLNSLFLLFVSAFFLLVACTQPSPQNTQATIDAAVKATSEAQQSMQATIEAAVKATTTQGESAQKSAIDQSVQATINAQPAPDYTSMTQEEMAGMIEETVNKAMTDYTAAATAVTQSTSDGTVTDEEASTTYTYTYDVYYEVANAEEIIQAYYDYYGAYADDALASMNAMEQDLAAISESLNEIATILEQGSVAATAAIDQLNTVANQAQTKAGEIQTQLQGFQDQLKTGLTKREDTLINLPANNIADTQIGAINQANDFLDAFKTAISDGKFSPEELANIGQLAANAKASLGKTDDPKFQKLSGSIDGLTRNAARGEWGRARTGIGDFERSVPKRRK